MTDKLSDYASFELGNVVLGVAPHVEAKIVSGIIALEAEVERLRKRLANESPLEKIKKEMQRPRCGGCGQPKDDHPAWCAGEKPSLIDMQKGNDDA